jgi:hypothetical protein
VACYRLRKKLLAFCGCIPVGLLLTAMVAYSLATASGVYAIYAWLSIVLIGVLYGVSWQIHRRGTHRQVRAQTTAEHSASGTVNQHPG